MPANRGGAPQGGHQGGAAPKEGDGDGDGASAATATAAAEAKPSSDSPTADSAGAGAEDDGADARHAFVWLAAALGCARLRTAALRHERAARRHREVGWFVARHSSCVLVPWMIIVMRKHTHRFVNVKCALLRDDQIAI